MSDQDTTVDPPKTALKRGVLFADLTKIGRNLLQLFEVEARLACLALKRCHHGLGSTVAIGHAHRGYRRIDIVDTRLSSLDNRRRTQARGGMTLHMDRHRHGLLQARDQFKGLIRLQETRHILDGDGMGTHVLQPFGKINPHFDGMDGADGIGNRSLGMLAVRNGGLDSTLKVARIVERIENSEHVDAMNGRSLDKLVNNVIGVMAIAEEILRSKQHLKGRLGQRLLQKPQPIPRILTEITNTRIKGCPTPTFKGPKTNRVQLLTDGQHVINAKAGCQQGLVRISQHHIGNTQFGHMVSSF